MDSMKIWASIEEGRRVCCVVQSVRVLWDCPAYTSIGAFLFELRGELVIWIALQLSRVVNIPVV